MDVAGVVLHNATMSQESFVSTNSSMSNLGMEDSGLSFAGVYTMVLGGGLVWPLALHQLVMAKNCWSFLEHFLVGVDFVPVPLGRSIP